MRGGIEEPILTDEDRTVWATWLKTWEAHARSRAFANRLDVAKSRVEEALMREPSCVAWWSGGKDSTAMMHLIRVEIGADVPAIAHKDSCDFPGSEEYVMRYAAEWGLRLTIVRPPIDPAQWFSERSGLISGLADIHSRKSELARATWWDFVDKHNAAFGLRFVGMRAQESRGRRTNRKYRGHLYPIKQSRSLPRGQWCSTPIVDWQHNDVYAYCVSRGIDLHPLYQCVAFAHRDAPWWLRDEWWVPDERTGATGSVAWLRRYWPSLYQRLCLWMPAASSMT